MKNIVRSKDFASVTADWFEVLVDNSKRRTPVIGLKVNPIKGEPFIMPIELKAAKGVAEHILGTVLCVAPELFKR